MSDTEASGELGGVPMLTSSEVLPSPAMKDCKDGGKPLLTGGLQRTVVFGVTMEVTVRREGGGD